MEFIKYIDKKNIITEAFAEVDNMEPTTEGWGKIAASLIFGNLGNVIHWAFSMTNLQQLGKNKEFVNYIKTECNKILKEEQRKDKSVTKNCPNGPLKMFQRWWHGSDDVPFFSLGRWLNWRSDWVDDKLFLDDIEGFNITYFFDTDHVDAIVVVLWSADKEKFIGRRIPEPKKSDLAKIINKEN